MKYTGSLQRILAQAILDENRTITWVSLGVSRNGLAYTAQKAGMTTRFDSLLGVNVYVPGENSVTWAHQILAVMKVRDTTSANLRRKIRRICGKGAV
jgi:hypothetical protein